MKPVPERIVNTVHQEFSGVQIPELREKASDLHEEQPELMAFVQASISQVEGDAADLAVYLFFMVCRMYQDAYGDDVGVVESSDIMTRYKENEEQIEQLAQREGDVEGHSFGLDTQQPHLIEYLMEVLKGARDEEKENLDAGEQAYVFLILSTVMTVLNYAVKKAKETQ